MTSPYEFEVTQRPPENQPVLVLTYTDAQQRGDTVEIPLRVGIPMMMDALLHLVRAGHGQRLRDEPSFPALLEALKKLEK